jgi:chorismate mutase
MAKQRLIDLKSLRKEIDQCDRVLMRAVAKRMKLVKKIGQLKRSLGLPVVQPARFKEMLALRIRIAARLGLEADFTKKLFRLLHSESIRIQKRRSKK